MLALHIRRSVASGFNMPVVEECVGTAGMTSRRCLAEGTVKAAMKGNLCHVCCLQVLVKLRIICFMSVLKFLWKEGQTISCLVVIKYLSKRFLIWMLLSLLFLLPRTAPSIITSDYEGTACFWRDVCCIVSPSRLPSSPSPLVVMLDLCSQNLKR